MINGWMSIKDHMLVPHAGLLLVLLLGAKRIILSMQYAIHCMVVSCIRYFGVRGWFDYTSGQRELNLLAESMAWFYTGSRYP
jgi:hypothetical protein